MDEDKARGMLRAERGRVQGLLDSITASGDENRAAAGEPGDRSDAAESLIAEQTDDAVAATLYERLDAIRRAEQRLEEGTFGRSVRSGLPIPDDRLRADPAAELTIEEAEQDEDHRP